MSTRSSLETVNNALVDLICRHVEKYPGNSMINHYDEFEEQQDKIFAEHNWNKEEYDAILIASIGRSV
jgi:hypothetical protein